MWESISQVDIIMTNSYDSRVLGIDRKSPFPIPLWWRKKYKSVVIGVVINFKKKMWGEILSLEVVVILCSLFEI